MKKHAVVSLLAVAALLVAACLGRPEAPRRMRPAGQVPEALRLSPCAGLPPAEPAAGSPLRYRYRVGDRLIYRVGEAYEAETALSLQDRTAPPRPTRVGLDLEGRWVLSVASIDDRGATLVGRFEESTVSATVNGRPSDPQAVEAIRGALAMGAGAVVAPTGELMEAAFPREMPARARDMVKGLLLALHLRLPASECEAWEADERDLTGAFRASYTLDPAWYKADGRRLRRITRARGGRADLPKGWNGTDSGKGVATAWFDPRDGLVVQLEAEETLEYASANGGQRVAATGRTWMRLERVESGAGVSSSWAAMERSVPDRGEGSEESKNEAEANRRAELSAGKCVTGVAVELERLLGSGKASSTDAWEAVETLVALFQRDGAAVREAFDIAMHGLNSERVRSQLLCCLGMAGTPAAQHALVEALGDAGLPPRLRRSALVAMTQVASPLPSLEAEARRAAVSGDPDVSAQGLLALGQMAHQLLPTDADRAAGIRSWLGERYQAASTRDERIVVLEAFGNAGDPSALGLLRAAAADPDEGVRAAAMTGLRRVAAGDAEALLLAGLKDPSEAVQGAARQALAARGGERRAE